MAFRQFWDLYLRGHSLPGTRSLHYFATCLGALCAAEAVASRQPLFALGIALSYAFAIGAHRFIERNEPLIKVSPLWGIVADLKMSWLALRGRLGSELERSGAGRPGDALFDGAKPSRMARGLDAASALLATLGLAWAIADLGDLFEPPVGLGYDLVQLGAPVVAFCAAALSAFGALAISVRQQFGTGRAAAAAASLRRAAIALLLTGTIAFVGAELGEHGAAATPSLAMGLSAAVVVLVVLAALFAVLGRRDHRGDPTDTFAASISKVACFSGSAVAAALGAAALCWQAGPIFSGGYWRGLSVAELMQVEAGQPALVSWLLSTPSWLAFCIMSFALMLLGVTAAELELTKRANQLYAFYLAQARRNTAQD